MIADSQSEAELVVADDQSEAELVVADDQSEGWVSGCWGQSWTTGGKVKVLQHEAALKRRPVGPQSNMPTTRPPILGGWRVSYILREKQSMLGICLTGNTMFERGLHNNANKSRRIIFTIHYPSHKNNYPYPRWSKIDNTLSCVYHDMLSLIIRSLKCTAPLHQLFI